MKVFVNGMNHIKKNEGKWVLPASVIKYLDELMADEVEFLVDDRTDVAIAVQDYLKSSKYKNVKVCVAGGKSWTKLNLGRWDELHFCVHGWGSTSYSSGIERDFNMTEIADTGVAIWDGNDFNTFANMLCLCVLGKPVKLYLISEGRWIDVNSIEDIREFKGPDEELSEDEIFDVMTCCKVPVETMRSVVLEDDEEVLHILLDCINQADIPLEKKLELLELLSAKQNMKHEVFCAVEKAVKHGKSWKRIKHDVRAIADYRPVDCGEAEMPWDEIRKNIYEIDKILHPKKYAKHFILGNKTITFE
jgi:hypothetical protein